MTNVEARGLLSKETPLYFTMDSASGAPRFPSPQHANSVPHAGGASHNPVDGSRRIANNLGGMRRGHSEGELLSNAAAPYRRTADETLREGETWLEFLKPSVAGAELATIRAATMATDRKRRLTGPQEEQARRRSASSMSVAQTASAGMRQSALQSTNNHPLALPTTAPPESNTGPVLRAFADRPLPPRPNPSNSQSRRSSEITLPCWQLDTEVSSCPICGAKFSFWFRKHHCRKCGRVVCANCSPHRITIPRQFIVHSPSECASDPNPENRAGPTVIDLTSDDEDNGSRRHNPGGFGRVPNQGSIVDSALGGGQEVRLCNPCVPDPNPLPHLPYESRPNRWTLNSFPTPENNGHMNEHRLQHSREPHRRPTIQTRADAGPLPYGAIPGFDLNRASQPSSFTSVGSSPSTRRESQDSQTQGASSNYASMYSGSAPNPSTHDPHLLPYFGQYRPPQVHQRLPSISSSLRHSHPPPNLQPLLRTPVPTQIPLKEEDECPICHSALPLKAPDGSEKAREAHISLCIDSHFSASSSSSAQPYHSSLSSVPAISAAAAAGIHASPTTFIQGRPGPAFLARSEAFNDRSSTGMPRRRTTGMVVYHASEKDCVGEDGEGMQECVICFEEFSVGVEMGRLECLCKFHKACIRQWWDTKGVGACPVHQGGI